MKIAPFITGLLFIMLFAFQADAGYQEMKKEFEAYGPPSYLQIGGQLSVFREVATPDTDFDAEKHRISEQANVWKESAFSTPGINGFFRPDPQLFQRLRETAGDSDKIRGKLGKGLSLDVLEVLAFLRNLK